MLRSRLVPVNSDIGRASSTAVLAAREARLTLVVMFDGENRVELIGEIRPRVVVEVRDCRREMYRPEVGCFLSGCAKPQRNMASNEPATALLVSGASLGTCWLAELLSKSILDRGM